MSPLDAAKHWFETLDESIRHEAMDMLAISIDQDHWSLVDDERRNAVLKWLTVDGNPHRIGIRAVMFRALFEFACGSRMNVRGWDNVFALHRRVAEDAAADPNSNAARIVESSKRMMQELPARMSRWLAIAPGWEDLKAKHLNDEAVQEWIFSQPLEELEPRTIAL